MNNLRHIDKLKTASITLVILDLVMMLVFAVISTLADGVTGELTAITAEMATPAVLLVAAELNAMRGGYKGLKGYLISQLLFVALALASFLLVAWMLSFIDIVGCKQSNPDIVNIVEDPGICIVFDSEKIWYLTVLYSMSMTVGLVIGMFVQSVRRMLQKLVRSYSSRQSQNK